MLKARRGVIINMASQSGVCGEAYNSLYCATKFAVVGFTQAIALELAEYGIRANAVCPGPVDTSLTRQGLSQFSQYYGLEAGEFREQLLKQIPLKRFARVEEIAEATAFLCSDEASYITGASLLITGRPPRFY